MRQKFAFKASMLLSDSHSREQCKNVVIFERRSVL